MNKETFELLSVIDNAINQGACTLEDIQGQDALNLLLKYNAHTKNQDEVLSGIVRLLTDKAFDNSLETSTRYKLAELIITHENYVEDLTRIFEMQYAIYEGVLEYII